MISKNFSILDRFMPATQDILFDVGSSNTRIAIGGSVVFNEPTCIAVHTQSDAVIAIGYKAAALLGKTPSSISVVFPIKAGRVSSEVYATRFMEAVLQSVVQSNLISAVLGFSAKVVVPAKLSPVEMSVWERTIRSVGVSRLSLVSNAQALYAAIAGPKALTHSVCVIDLGGQKTDFAVLSAGEVVAAQTYKTGGVECTEMIQDYLRMNELFIVGWQSAEECKKEVGQVSCEEKKVKDKKLAVRGKDAHYHVAKTVIVTSSMFQESLCAYADTLLKQLKQFFSLVPPELAAGALERGIYFTGAGSQLKGLDAHLQDNLKTEFIMLPEPGLSSIKGLIALQQS